MSIKDSEAYLLLLTGKKLIIDYPCNNRYCHYNEEQCWLNFKISYYHPQNTQGKANGIWCPWLNTTQFWTSFKLDKKTHGKILLRLVNEY